MKLEIRKEVAITDERPWYVLYKDESYIIGSYTLENVEKVYDKMKKERENFKMTTTEVVKSEEI